MRFRAVLLPVAQLGAQLGPWSAIIGSILRSAALIQIGFLMFGAALVFQLLNLPIEFDASRRAKDQLVQMGFYDGARPRGHKKGVVWGGHDVRGRRRHRDGATFARPVFCRSWAAGSAENVVEMTDLQHLSKPAERRFAGLVLLVQTPPTLHCSATCGGRVPQLWVLGGPPRVASQPKCWPGSDDEESAARRHVLARQIRVAEMSTAHRRR